MEHSCKQKEVYEVPRDACLATLRLTKTHALRKFSHRWSQNCAKGKSNLPTNLHYSALSTDSWADMWKRHVLTTLDPWVLLISRIARRLIINWHRPFGRRHVFKAVLSDPFLFESRRVYRARPTPFQISKISMLKYRLVGMHGFCHLLFPSSHDKRHVTQDDVHQVLILFHLRRLFWRFSSIVAGNTGISDVFLQQTLLTFIGLVLVVVVLDCRHN